MSDVSKVVCRSPLDLFLFLVSFFHPFESSPPRPPRLRSVDIIRGSFFTFFHSQSEFGNSQKESVRSTPARRLPSRTFFEFSL